MSAPSLLLFDLGGVLIENSVFESLGRLIPEPLDIETLKHRWLASSAVRRFELAEIAPNEFAETFLSEWNLDLSPTLFLEEFRSWPRDFYPEARATIRVLRRRYRVGCLSNSNVVHWEKFGAFEEDFDIALSSHLLGAIKPDEEAFVLALRQCEREPSAIFFFDDSAANVHTARRLGIRAFQVEGFASLLSVLRAESLLPC